MLERLVDAIVLFEPACGLGVQVVVEGRVAFLELPLQQAAEQPVIDDAVRDARHEQVAVLGFGQPVRTVTQPQRRRAQFRREPFQRGRRQQEIAQARRLSAQHQRGERIEQPLRPLAAVEHRALKVGGQGPQGQEDPGGPAFQARGEVVDLGGRGRQIQDLTREAVDLGRGEFQLLLAERQHLAPGDHLGERQIRQDAPDQDQVAVRRQQRHDPAQPRLGAGRTGEVLDVVEDVDEVLGGVVPQVVGYQPGQLHRGVADRVAGQVLDARRNLFQRREAFAVQVRHVAIALLQGLPGDRVRRLIGELRDDGRLAIAGWGADQG